MATVLAALGPFSIGTRTIARFPICATLRHNRNMEATKHTYNKLIDRLKGAGLVHENRSNLLTWTGPVFDKVTR